MFTLRPRNDSAVRARHIDDGGGVHANRPPMLGALPVAHADTTDFTPLAAQDEVAPSLVGLFHAVQALRTGGGAFVLQFVAPHRGAGTSMIAAGFAAQAARAGNGGVLLVDVSPSATANADDETQALLGGIGLGRPVTGRPGLCTATLASRLQAGAALCPNAVAQLRTRFDVVVLDCAALAVLPQVAMLARHCDGTALVVQAERTERDEVMAARRSIEAMGGQILGAVFNRARIAPRRPHGKTGRMPGRSLAPG